MKPAPPRNGQMMTLKRPPCRVKSQKSLAPEKWISPSSSSFLEDIEIKLGGMSCSDGDGGGGGEKKSRIQNRHKPTPAVMLCKYYLRGKCTKDDCAYIH